MSKKAWILVAVLVVASVSATAAETTGPAKKMEAFATMAGTWEGTGWMRRGPGEPDRFVGREVVEPGLDGAILKIEGTHWTADRSRVVHHAFAVISPAEEGEEFRFRSWLSNGRSGDYRLWREGEDIVWEMTTPAGRVRYFIRLTDDTWVETGKIERDGEWHDFLGLNLKRVK